MELPSNYIICCYCYCRVIALHISLKAIEYAFWNEQQQKKKIKKYIIKNARNEHLHELTSFTLDTVQFFACAFISLCYRVFPFSIFSPASICFRFLRFVSVESMASDIYIKLFYIYIFIFSMLHATQPV